MLNRRNLFVGAGAVTAAVSAAAGPAVKAEAAGPGH